MSEKLDRFTKPANQQYEEGWHLWSANPTGPWALCEIVYDEKTRSLRIPFGKSGERILLSGYFRPGHDPSLPKLMIDRVAELGALYSPFGHVACEDGTVYTLTRYAMHGVLEAILFPDLAAEQGYCPPVEPVDENNVYLYQAFDLDNCRTLGVLRISIGRLSAAFTIDKAHKPATEAQKKAVRDIFKAHGIGRNEKVFAGYTEMTPAQVMKWLDKDDS